MGSSRGFAREDDFALLMSITLVSFVDGEYVVNWRLSQKGTIRW
jgi:hypothetical protein